MNFSKIINNSFRGIKNNLGILLVVLVVYVLNYIFDFVALSSYLGLFNSLGFAFFATSIYFYCLVIVRNQKITKQPFLYLFNLQHFNKFVATWLIDCLASLIINFILFIPFLFFIIFVTTRNVLAYSTSMVVDIEYFINTQNYVSLMEIPGMREMLGNFSLIIYVYCIFIYFGTMYRKYIYFIAYDSKQGTKSSDIFKLSLFFFRKNVFRFILVDFGFIALLFCVRDLPYLYSIANGSFSIFFNIPLIILICAISMVRRIFHASFYEEVVRLYDNKGLVRSVIKEEILNPTEATTNTEATANIEATSHIKPNSNIKVTKDIQSTENIVHVEEKSFQSTTDTITPTNTVVTETPQEINNVTDSQNSSSL